MRRTVIKNIIQIVINTVLIAAAYKLGNKNGYEEGWHDGEMAGACRRCVHHDDELEDCPDIPDFEGKYS